MPGDAFALFAQLRQENAIAAFFIDFKFEDKDPVKLVGAPASCQMNFQRPGEADVKKLTEEMVASGDNANYGAIYANKILVKCP